MTSDDPDFMRRLQAFKQDMHCHGPHQCRRKHKCHGLCLPCYRRFYREQNRERINHNARLRYHANPEPKRRHNREWKEENAEYVKQIELSWKRRNRVHVNAMNRKRYREKRNKQLSINEERCENEQAKH